MRWHSDQMASSKDFLISRDFLLSDGQQRGVSQQKSDQRFFADDERHSYWGLPFPLASYVLNG